MKEAVGARNAFAAAHSAYAMSLKNTGAALSDYAHGEVQNPQLVTGEPHQSSSSAAAAVALQPPLDPLLPPPPPPSLTTSPAPIQRAASMPEMMKMQKTRENGVGPTIEEENDGDDEDDEIESNEKLIMRKRSSGRNRSGDHQKKEEAGAPQDRAPPQKIEDSESVYDFFFQPVETYPGPSLEVKEEEVMENVESKVFDEIPKRKENVEEKRKEVPLPPPPVVDDFVDEERVVAAAASGGGSVGRREKRGKSMGGVGEKRAGKGSTNLLQEFVKLDDHFLKASESAHDVSKMLEATRLHYHSNFADNRGISLV